MPKYAVKTQPASTERSADVHQTHHMEETHSLACGFPATPAMACWPICIPMAPMPPTGAPVGRGPMPMAPGPPPTPVRLVRAFMGSSRRDNRQYYAAPTCTAEIMNTMSLEVTAEDRTQQGNLSPSAALTWTPQRLLVCEEDKRLSETSTCTTHSHLQGDRYSRMSLKWMMSLATRDKYSSCREATTAPVKAQSGSVGFLNYCNASCSRSLTLDFALT